MDIKLTNNVSLDSGELYSLVRRANGLRGRQKIDSHCREGNDGWAFYSNARGGYGELLSFHYDTTTDLLQDIGL